MANKLACPTCDGEGKTVPLEVNGGNGFKCEKGHTFNDTSALVDMHPRMIEGTTTKKAREGMAEFKTTLPAKLIEALGAKFGASVPAVIEAVSIAVLDPGAFVVSGFDADRLTSHFGSRPKDGSGLVGLVVSVKTERDEFRREAEAAKSATPNAPAETNNVQGDFVQIGLRIPIDDFMKIKSKASGNTVEYMQTVISNALENKWF